GEAIREIVVTKTKAVLKKDFNPIRKNIVKFQEVTERERIELIKKDRRYGKMVCRCEKVTEAEIVEAIHRPLGAKSIDGIKKRTRAGMGRCQSGFCMNRIIEILSEELGISIEEVTKFGGDSQILLGDIKEGFEGERRKEHV
ncbi:MAG: (2Fe-2S)-binding protein, partial [Cellulosilyticaceae bacterium]